VALSSGAPHLLWENPGTASFLKFVKIDLTSGWVPVPDPIMELMQFNLQFEMKEEA
jgi:hypothetical protein